MVSSRTIRRRKRPPPLTPSRDRRDQACARCAAYTPHRASACPWGYCTDYYCQRCRRYTWGVGPLACPCDTGRNISGGHGHHTRPEQPRPAVPAKRTGAR